MNWFERYGIVGMFFIVMTGMWYFCLFPGARELFSKINPELLKFIGGFCGLSFLPFGYIIMAWSQAWYYSINKENSIHCRYWDLLKSEEQGKKIIKIEKEKNLGEVNENDEARLEAILMYYDRKYFYPLKTNKFISSFATKRFEVIAINGGLIWAIIFSLIAAICIEGIILDITIKWNAFSTWFVIILALSIVSILYSLERILERQIFEVGRRKQRDMQVGVSEKDSD